MTGRAEDIAGSPAPDTAGIPGLGVAPSLLRDTAGSVSAGIGGQLALVASGILGARLLGVTNRGNLALLVLFVTIATQVGSLGVPLALTYWLAKDGGLTRDARRALGRFIGLQLAAVTLLQAIALVLVFHSASAHVQRAALITLASTPANLIYVYALASLQGQRRFAVFNFNRLTFPVLYALLLVALDLSGDRSLEVVSLAWTLTAWASAAAAAAGSRVAIVREEHDVGREPPLRRMLAFGIRAVLGAIAPLESFQLDQAIVGLFISSTALGFYVVGVAFTNLPRFIAQSIGLVAYPHVAGEDNRSHARTAIARFMLATLVVCGSTVLAIEVALPWLVPHLFGRAFAPAIAISRVLLVSALMVSLRRVLGDCARGVGLPGIGTLSEVIALALFPAVLAITSGDAIGVAWALVISGSIALAAIVARVIRAVVRDRATPPNPESRRGPNDSVLTVSRPPPTAD